MGVEGAELDEHVMGVEGAELDVSFALKDRSKEEFLGALRRDLSMIPGMNTTIGQPISHRIDHMLSGTRASVAVKIFGEDLYKIRELGEATRQAMSEVAGVVDLSVEQQMDIPILKVRLDRPSIARHGMQIQDVGIRASSTPPALPPTRPRLGPVPPRPSCSWNSGSRTRS